MNMLDGNQSTEPMIEALIREAENLVVDGTRVIDHNRPYATDSKGVPLPNTPYYQICNCASNAEAQRVLMALKLLAFCKKTAMDNGGSVSFQFEILKNA